jgi:nucleoid DNA-binding protein
MVKKSKSQSSLGKLKSKAKKVTNRTTSPVTQLKAISEKQTKTQILKVIAEETGLSTTQVKQVFSKANYLASCHLISRGSGEFAIPEMAVKIVRKTKPATKARQGRNPLTGESITIAAKPKRNVIKVKLLKALKELVL